VVAELVLLEALAAIHRLVVRSPLSTSTLFQAVALNHAPLHLELG